MLIKITPRKFLLILLVTFLNPTNTMSKTSTLLWSEISGKVNANKNGETKTDVTSILENHIPVGSKVNYAKSILVANQFAVKMNLANGSNYLVGRRELSRSILGFDEVVLTMKIVDEKTTTTVGLVFRHRL